MREIVLEAADWDRRLRDKLLFAAKSSAGSDPASLRALVRQSTRTSGFLDWREATGYGEQLDQLAILLEQRIGDGNSGLVEVIEEAIAHAETALEQIDDSNGEVYPASERLREVHRLACATLRPEPVALADRLFGKQIKGTWDTFYTILPDYQDKLGLEGLAHYRQLVEEKWESLPSLTSARQRGEHWDHRRHRIEHAMEGLARLSGGIDKIAAINAKDLSSSRRCLDLALLYHEHERFDEALAWVEKGISSFRGDHILELLSFVIE